MSFFITHRYGETVRDPSPSVFHDLLNEVNDRPEDEEHASVSVTHESEWSLGTFGGGYLIWENLEDGEPRHMTGVSKERILFLWEALANGDIEQIDREPWLAGY